MFLDEVGRLREARLTDRALDLIFRWFNDELKVGNTRQCSMVLRAVDESTLDEDLIVGFLAATYAARHLLASRAAFVQRVRAKLIADIGAAAAGELLRELT
jgi:hypothetical protein